MGTDITICVVVFCMNSIIDICVPCVIHPGVVVVFVQVTEMGVVV